LQINVFKHLWKKVEKKEVGYTSSGGFRGGERLPPVNAFYNQVKILHMYI